MRIQTALLTIGMFCAPLTLGGQTKPVSDRPPSAQQQRDITELRAQIIELQSKLKTLEATLKFDEWQIKQKQDAQSAITLNLSEHTYQRLDLDNGFLLVSTQDAAPYLSGYNIRLTLATPRLLPMLGSRQKSVGRNHTTSINTHKRPTTSGKRAFRKRKYPSPTLSKRVLGLQ